MVKSAAAAVDFVGSGSVAAQQTFGFRRPSLRARVYSNLQLGSQQELRNCQQ